MILERIGEKGHLCLFSNLSGKAYLILKHTLKPNHFSLPPEIFQVPILIFPLSRFERTQHSLNLELFSVANFVPLNRSYIPQG